MSIIREFTIPATPGSRACAIILHRSSNGYATHYEARDGKGGRWWGHYFETHEEANQDFIDRVSNHIANHGVK